MGSWTVRQKAAGAGAGTGLLLTVLMSRVSPQNRVLYGFKSRFWEGVTYGVGGALGVIWSLGLLHRTGDILEERRLREQMRAEETPSEKEKKTGSEGAVQSFGAGFIAAVVLSVGVGIGLAVIGSKLRRSGVGQGSAEPLSEFRNRVGYGASLGMGFLLSATALNWAVEQWDELNSDDSDKDEPDKD